MTTHPQAERIRELETLPGDERAVILAHVRTCRACRAVLVAECPEALFGLLAERPIPTEALDRLSANVAAAIDDLDGVTTAPAAPRRRWALVGSIAASLLLAFVIGGPLLDRSHDAPITEVAELPAVVTEPVPEAPMPPAGVLPVVRGVELLSSPGDAEVVDFAIGDAQVVMIFDKELDI